MKYFVAAVIIFASQGLRAQSRTAFFQKNPTTVDWRPEEKTGNRYTVAVHPFFLTQRGLRIDFEKELPSSGKWLQFGIMGYYVPRFDRGNGYWTEGWENLLSNQDPFDKLSGAGFNLSYKNIFHNRGWYYNTGVQFNHYNVDHERIRYIPVTENGLTVYERKPVLAKTRYNQPAAFFNFGKHASVTKDVFIDFYIGLGYMHSFYSGDINPFNSYRAFGYRGLCFNGGFRIGVCWNGKRK